MRLPLRLEKALSLVDNFLKGADIACDHAYLSRKLLVTKKAQYMIATDIAEGPLLAAKRTLLPFGNRAEIRKGYGLQPLLANEVDVIFICGLGAETMVEILADGIKRFENTEFILQVNGDPSPLREFLLEYPIAKEAIVLDRDRYYQIINVKKGYPLGKERWLTLGPGLRLGSLVQEPVAQEYMKKRLQDIKKAIKNLQPDDLRGAALREEASFYERQLFS